MALESINFDLESARQQFAGANAIANNILDQNDRGALIEQDLEDEDFQALAREGLAEEQQATIIELHKISQEAPYKELGQALLTLEARQTEVVSQLRDIEDELELKRWEIDEQAQKTAKIAPYAGEKARMLAEEKKAQLSDGRIDELKAMGQAFEQARRQVDELFVDALGAWPVPSVGHMETAREDYEELIVDEMPVDPNIHDHAQAERLRVFSERHVDEPMASKLIAFYLGDNAAKIVSVRELVDFVYKADVIESKERNALRSRITTMLGPKIQGPRIQAMLAEDNMVLQYGIRRVTKVDIATNKIIESQRKRIYRAMQRDSLVSEYLEPIHEENIEGVEKETVDITWAVKPDQLEQAIANDGLIQPEEQTTTRQVETPAAEEGPAETVEPEPKAQQTKLSKKRFGRRTHNGEKLREFGRDVRDAILTLDADNLICEEFLSQKTIIGRSKSKIMGTKEAIERLVKADLLPRSILKEPDIRLGASQIVTMRLFNTHPEVLGKNNREIQRRAVQMIESAVQKHLEAKQRPQ